MAFPSPANQNALEEPPSRLSARWIFKSPATSGTTRIAASSAKETWEQNPSAIWFCAPTATKVRRAERELSRPGTARARSIRNGPAWTASVTFDLRENSATRCKRTSPFATLKIPESNRAFRNGAMTPVTDEQTNRCVIWIEVTAIDTGEDTSRAASRRQDRHAARSVDRRCRAGTIWPKKPPAQAKHDHHRLNFHDSVAVFEAMPRRKFRLSRSRSRPSPGAHSREQHR